MSDEKNEVTVSSTKLVFEEGNDLVSKISRETDLAKLDELTNLFKINQRKKDLLRLNKLNGIQELIDDEVLNRVGTYADALDNEELVSYMKITNSAVNNIKMSMETPAPIVQINNQHNEINMHSSEFNRESREKIVNAVQAILNSIDNKDIIDVNIKQNEEER